MTSIAADGGGGGGELHHRKHAHSQHPPSHTDRSDIDGGRAGGQATNNFLADCASSVVRRNRGGGGGGGGGGDDDATTCCGTTGPPAPSPREKLAWYAAAVHLVVLACLHLPSPRVHPLGSLFKAGDSDMVFHGGHPLHDPHPGSCYCGPDLYCMCTPALRVKCVLTTSTLPVDDDSGSTSEATHLVLVRRRGDGAGSRISGGSNSELEQQQQRGRRQGRQLAIIGGPVEFGESVEAALARHLREQAGFTVVGVRGSTVGVPWCGDTDRGCTGPQVSMRVGLVGNDELGEPVQPRLVGMRSDPPPSNNNRYSFFEGLLNNQRRRGRRQHHAATVVYELHLDRPTSGMMSLGEEEEEDDDGEEGILVCISLKALIKDAVGTTATATDATNELNVNDEPDHNEPADVLGGAKLADVLGEDDLAVLRDYGRSLVAWREGDASVNGADGHARRGGGGGGRRGGMATVRYPWGDRVASEGEIAADVARSICPA